MLRRYSPARHSTNHLWMGEWAIWSMGHGATVNANQRVQAPVGCTIARENFATSVTAYHVRGINSAHGIRIQRNATNAATDSANVVMALSPEETKPLAGRVCRLEFNCAKGDDFSGSTITIRVQYSIEPSQVIINADGTYTNGQTVLLTQAITPTSSGLGDGSNYSYSFTLPEAAVQMAVVISVPFTGTAGTYDFVLIDPVCVYPANTTLVRDDFSILFLKSQSRFQCSYPYGIARGTATEQGTVQGTAIGTATSFAITMPIRFSPPMAYTPKFIFQSPTSGTESRIHDKTAGTNINGLAYGLSNSGVTITNNAAATNGNRYLCHWTAEACY